MKSKLHTVLALTILTWSVLFAGDVLLVSPATLGPHDFNGHSSSLATNIVGGLLVAGSLAQVYLAVLVVRRPMRRLFIAAIVGAALSLLTLPPLSLLTHI